MIIENKNAKQELLYSAYGFTVYGIISTYKWTYDGSGRTENCLANHIIINDTNNNEIYNRYLGNNCIFIKTFKRNIDNILWYLNKESVNNYELDKIIQNALIENNSIFSHKIEQRKQKEKQEIENNKRIAENKVIEDNNKQEIKVYCNKKNLYCTFIYNTVYVFKINKNKEKVIQLLNNANSEKMKKYIDYAEKYPNNELTFIYSVSDYNNFKDTLINIKNIA